MKTNSAKCQHNHRKAIECNSLYICEQNNIGTLCALWCSPRSSPIHNTHISIIRCTAAAWSKGSACSCRACRQCLTCKHVWVFISTSYNSLQSHVRCVKSALGGQVCNENHVSLSLLYSVSVYVFARSTQCLSTPCTP